VVKSEELETGNDSVVQTEPRPDPQPNEEVDVAMPQRTTSPAFQAYPSDFLSSEKVARMSYTEIGIYWVLLCHAWQARGLPNSPTEIAKMLKLNPSRFTKLWSGVLSECWVENSSGRLVNPRQERERQKQNEYRRRQTDKANTRWHKPGNAAALPERHASGNALQSSSLSLSLKKKEKDICAEPQSDSTPIVMNFPVVGNPNQVEWALHQGRIDAWQVAYPNLDVLAECRRAEVWTRANPDRRKTAKGMPAFLVKWMNRQTDNRTSPLSAGSSASKPMPKWYQDVQARKAAQS
jgi:uncharacterized protein YdaU (DUF1376 family)